MLWDELSREGARQEYAQGPFEFLKLIVMCSKDDRPSLPGPLGKPVQFIPMKVASPGQQASLFRIYLIGNIIFSFPLLESFEIGTVEFYILLEVGSKGVVDQHVKAVLVDNHPRAVGHAEIAEIVGKGNVEIFLQRFP